MQQGEMFKTERRSENECEEREKLYANDPKPGDLSMDRLKRG